MTRTAPAKRAVLTALTRVFSGPWEYHEYGPDAFGWFHARVEFAEGLADLHVHAKTRDEMRRRMLAVTATFGDAQGVDARHLWIMVLGYVRYAMGRMSTAPSTASELVRVYWHRFTRHQQEQFLREVSQELEVYERNGQTLGHKCDHETWTELRDWMKERLP